MRMQVAAPAESNVQVAGTYTIHADAKMFSILSSKLYTNPIRAIVREICTNAHDAHILAGTPDIPFDVTLPSVFNQTYKVRDYGPGMSEDQVREIFTCYGRSTKDDSDLFNGAMGLGSKSPFGYAPTFSVRSYNNERATTYLMYLLDGLPQYTVGETEDAPGERNGLEVIVPVTPGDERRFETEAASVIPMLDLHPRVNGMSIDEWLEERDLDLSTVGIIDAGDVTVRAYDEAQASVLRLPRGPEFSVRMAGVVYPVNTTLLQDGFEQLDSDNFEAGAVLSLLSSGVVHVLMGKSGAVVFDVPTGSVQFTPSREELQYDMYTIRNLMTMLAKALNVMYADIAELINDETKTALERIELITAHPLMQSRGASAATDTTSTHHITGPSIHALEFNGMYDAVAKLYISVADEMATKHGFVRDPSSTSMFACQLGATLPGTTRALALAIPGPVILPRAGRVYQYMSTKSDYRATTLEVDTAFDEDHAYHMATSSPPSIDGTMPVAEVVAIIIGYFRRWTDLMTDARYISKNDDMLRWLPERLQHIGPLNDMPDADEAEAYLTRGRDSMLALRDKAARLIFSSDFKNIIVPPRLTMTMKARSSHSRWSSDIGFRPIVIFERDGDREFSETLTGRIQKEALGEQAHIAVFVPKGDAPGVQAALTPLRAAPRIVSMATVYADMRAQRAARKTRELDEFRVRRVRDRHATRLVSDQWGELSTKPLCILVSDDATGEYDSTFLHNGTKYALTPRDVWNLMQVFRGLGLATFTGDPSVVVLRPKEYASITRKGLEIPTFGEWFGNVVDQVSGLVIYDQVRAIVSEAVAAGARNWVPNRERGAFFWLYDALKESADPSHVEVAAMLAPMVTSEHARAMAKYITPCIMGNYSDTIRDLVKDLFEVDDTPTSTLTMLARRYPLASLDLDTYDCDLNSAEADVIATHTLNYIAAIGPITP